MKKAVIFILKILLPAAAIGLVWGWYDHSRDYVKDFRERRGTLSRAGLDSVGRDSLFEKLRLRLENDQGLRVVCGMLIPRADTRRLLGQAERARPGLPRVVAGMQRFPAVILLGGKATGKYAIDYVMNIRDAIIVAPDYPYEPRGSYTMTQFLRDVPAMRKAILDMIPSVMLVADYLYSRDDVDTTRMVMLGYSFGAPFVPCIVASDRRFAAAAMVFGGGDLRSLIAHNVARYENPMTAEIVGWLSWLLLHPVEPLRYADRIAPIPLVMINGTSDEQIPRENAEIMFAEARMPKKLIWLDSRHVNPRNADLTARIVATLRGELAAMNILCDVPQPLP
jgi:dienelactone hydrolase